MMEKTVSTVAAIAAAAVSSVLVVQRSLGSTAEGHAPPRIQDIQRPLERVAFGSCNDQSFPQPLWPTIAAHEPDLWLWMGDNIYADIKELGEPGMLTFPPQKMFTEAEPDVLLTRYGKLHANADYAAFVNKTPVIGIWDDHDFGINDGYKDYTYRVQSQQIFLDFIGEPQDSPRRKQEGIYTSYTVGTGEHTVKFLLLDNRYNRDAYGTEHGTEHGTLLGETQWQWFEQELLASTAAFNVIVSGVQILPADRFAVAECWARFPHERERLLRTVLKSHAKGVILLSGDVHFSEINQVVCGNGATTLTEVTSSGMTHSWMQFHRPSVAQLMALLFTYANLLLPWEFRPEQDAFYGYLNWGSIEFDWHHEEHPVATVQVRGRDDRVKLKVEYPSVSSHSETPEEDAAACVAPRAMEPWRRWMWTAAFIATAAVFLLSLPTCALIGLWLVWYFVSRAFLAVFGGRREVKEAEDEAANKEKTN